MVQKLAEEKQSLSGVVAAGINLSTSQIKENELAAQARLSRERRSSLRELGKEIGRHDIRPALTELGKWLELRATAIEVALSTFTEQVRESISAKSIAQYRVSYPKRVTIDLGQVSKIDKLTYETVPLSCFQDRNNVFLDSFTAVIAVLAIREWLERRGSRLLRQASESGERAFKSRAQRELNPPSATDLLKIVPESVRAFCPVYLATAYDQGKLTWYGHRDIPADSDGFGMGDIYTHYFFRLGHDHMPVNFGEHRYIDLAGSIGAYLNDRLDKCDSRQLALGLAAELNSQKFWSMVKQTADSLPYGGIYLDPIGFKLDQSEWRDRLRSNLTRIVRDRLNQSLSVDAPATFTI